VTAGETAPQQSPEPSAQAPAVGPQKSLGKVAKKGVMWSFLREGVTEVLLFPSSMLVSRLLTPTEFGITSAALFFIQLAARLSDLGFNAALVRSKHVTREHFTSVFVVNVSIGVLAYAVLTGAAPFIGRFYNSPETGQILPFAALSFLIAPFGAVPGALLTRDLKFRELAIVDWNYCLTFALLSIVLAWMGYSYWSLVYARVASIGAQVLTRLYFTRWRPALRFKSAALRDVLSFGIGMHTRRLLDYTSGNLDNLVVGKTMGMGALGLYDKAYSTMNRFLNRLNTGGPAVMFRVFAMIHEEPERFRRAYSRVIMTATLVGLPILAIMFATAPHLIVVLFGANWRPAAVPFQLLCIAGALKQLTSYASSATQASGNVWSEVWRQLLYIAFIVGGIVALSPWGPTGAAAAVLMATAVMAVLMHLLLRRITGIAWADVVRPLVPGVLCASVGAGVAFLAEFLLVRSGVWTSEWLIFLTQGSSAVLACAAFVLFAPLRPLRDLVHELARDLAPAFLKRQAWFKAYVESWGGAPPATI
jgi:O-antigen/teichoic acid export membrane protein